MRVAHVNALNDRPGGGVPCDPAAAVPSFDGYSIPIGLSSSDAEPLVHVTAAVEVDAAL